MSYRQKVSFLHFLVFEGKNRLRMVTASKLSKFFHKFYADLLWLVRYQIKAHQVFNTTNLNWMVITSHARGNNECEQANTRPFSKKYLFSSYSFACKNAFCTWPQATGLYLNGCIGTKYIGVCFASDRENNKTAFDTNLYFIRRERKQNRRHESIKFYKNFKTGDCSSMQLWRRANFFRKVVVARRAGCCILARSRIKRKRRRNCTGRKRVGCSNTAWSYYDAARCRIKSRNP